MGARPGASILASLPEEHRPPHMPAGKSAFGDPSGTPGAKPAFSQGAALQAKVRHDVAAWSMARNRSTSTGWL